MKAESKFRDRAGLKCTVNRVAASKCCEWFDRVAGKYEYDDTPDDLWRRHDNCKCSIVYGTRRNRQVLRGTEKKWEVVADGVGAPDPVRLTPEQAAKLQAKHELKRLTSDSKPAIIKLADIEIGRSVGAKAKNYDIMDLETGEHYSLAEGTSLRNVQVFAGKGVKKTYERAWKYAKKFGGNVEDWQHVKGIGTVDFYGEYRDAELHWSQCDGYGKHDFFIKRWLE